MERLESQITWYDSKSIGNKRWYNGLKVTEIAAAAIIPVSVAVQATPWFAAVLGAFVVVIEGVQHLMQFQTNWISYRSTCEGLKHEKYLYLAMAPPYAGGADAHALLATRVESLVSEEHSKWVSVQTSPQPGRTP